MKKKIKGFFLGLLITILFTCTCFYVLVSLYYNEGFAYGTRICGIYCTGLDAETVNAKLKALDTKDTLTIETDFAGNEYISLSDIDYEEDYLNKLQEILDSQNPWGWPLELFKSIVNKNISPDISYDSAKLESKLSELKLLNNYGPDSELRTEILYSEDKGYYLVNENNPYITTDELLNLADTSLKDDCVAVIKYSDLNERTPDAGQEETLRLFGELEAFLSTKITYDLGDEQVPIDGAVLSLFIKRDGDDFVRNEDGSFYIDKESVDSYVESLCSKYYTYGQPRTYVTYAGTEKNISLSIYGTEINVNKEKEYLYNAIVTGVSEVRVPEYIHKPFHRGLNDIGDTFVEVNLTKQKLYYVQNGELIMDTDIVSGRPTGYATPEVVGYLYKKAEDVYLRGEGYVSFVNYWMPFYKADGMHDASWQKKYGGDRYLRYGSHGCINMQKEDAKKLYENIEVGTPVIVYK